MIKKSDIEKVKSWEDLADLGIGRVIMDIGYRGGVVGFYRGAVSEALGIEEHLLPIKVGAGCNYLGGGIRGEIFGSDYSYKVPKNKRGKLDALILACIRVYKYEEGLMLGGEEYDDGEPNWENIATNNARKKGIRRAY